MSALDREAAVVELLKAENELRQLRWQVEWFRKANKDLIEEIRRLRGDKEILATGSFT